MAILNRFRLRSICRSFHDYESAETAQMRRGPAMLCAALPVEGRQKLWRRRRVRSYQTGALPSTDGQQPLLRGESCRVRLP